MPCFLVQLPGELLWYIAQLLDKPSLRNFCLTCTKFRFEQELWRRMPQPQIYWAVYHRRLDIAQYLLIHNKADMNAPYKGRSPLMQAVNVAYDEAVSWLLRCPSINVSYEGHSGQTALSIAVLRVGLRLNEIPWPSVRSGANCERQSADLFWCQLDIVQRLLEVPGDEINVNAQDNMSCTPLHIAVYRQQFETINILLQDCRVNVNCPDWKRDTPLLIHIKNARFMRESWHPNRILDALLSRPDLDLNHRDKDGRTALWHAVKGEDVRTVDLLLQRSGIEVNVVDNFGYSALACAAQSGHLAIATALLGHLQIDVNAQSKGEMPPLCAACRAGHGPMVELLLSCDLLDINQPGPEGYSPL